MGTEWYLLCDDDMTAYQLGKGACQIATVIHEGKRGVELDAEMRVWLEDLASPGDVNFDAQFIFIDPIAYCARVEREVAAFLLKGGVRVDNDASWDEVWIETDGRDPYRMRESGCRVYRQVGSRYAERGVELNVIGQPSS
jgi:hypothetical protein